MSNEIRSRTNFVSGTLSVALSNVDTTMSSAGLASLAVIDSTNYAAIAIENEIVWVTTHTAAATTATILRAQEGTSAAAHSINVAWQHGPTAFDGGTDWQAYTPTDTNVTVSNGTRVARYTRIGRTIHFSWSLVWGNTTSYGGTVSVGLPAAAQATGRWAVTTYLLRSGVQNYSAGGFIDSGGSVAQVLVAGGGGINATTPWTWAVNDRLVVTGTYEAAT